MKAVYPFVGGTASQHKFNLKDPRDVDAAYRLVFNGGWTHSSTGALPNGSNAYANTYLHTKNVLTPNNLSIGLYTNTNRAADTSPSKIAYGNADNNTTYIPLTQFYLRISNGNLISDLGDYNYGRISGTNTNTAGFYVNTRTANNSMKVFKNNTLFGSSTTTNPTNILPNSYLYFAALNENGSYATSFEIINFQFSYVSDGLSDTEAANFYTAVQTFQTTLGRNVGAPIVADTDAQAFLNAAEITSQTQANAIDALVTDLKTANIWTKLKALYPFVGGTASAHKFNLKDPRDLDAAYRLVFNGGWTHSSSGAQPNGTTAFADTKLIPSSTLNLNSTHISVYLNTNYSSPGGTDVVDMGVEDASYTNRIFIEPFTGGNVYSINNSNGASFVVTPDSNSLGLYVNNRISSTAINLFKNNIKLINDTARTSSALSVRPLYIGAHNFVGSAAFLSPRRQAFASIGDSLTDTEALAFYTAVQKYQTSLGRQV